MNVLFPKRREEKIFWIRDLPLTIAIDARMRKHVATAHVSSAMLIREAASSQWIKPLPYVPRAPTASSCTVAAASRRDTRWAARDGRHIATMSAHAWWTAALETSKPVENQYTWQPERSCPFSGNVWRQTFCASASRPGNRKFPAAESMIRRRCNWIRILTNEISRLPTLERCQWWWSIGERF